MVLGSTKRFQLHGIEHTLEGFKKLLKRSIEKLKREKVLMKQLKELNLLMHQKFRINKIHS